MYIETDFGQLINLNAVERIYVSPHVDCHEVKAAFPSGESWTIRVFKATEKDKAETFARMMALGTDNQRAGMILAWKIK